MVFLKTLLCFLMVLLCVDLSYQEKAVSRQQRTSAPIKKASQSKGIKTEKFKLDLKAGQVLPTTRGRKSAGSDWLRSSLSTSRLGSSWYGFDNYVPRKGRSSPIMLGTSMRKSYVIGEGTMNSNNNNNNQIASEYHRQREPEINFNLVVPQIQMEGFYRQKVQDQGTLYGSLLDMTKSGGSYKDGKHDHNSYYQTNYAPIRPIPIPVIIKIIPLKMSTDYLNEALKGVPFIPLPITMFNALRESVSYNINEESDDDMKTGPITSQRNEGYVPYDDTVPHMDLPRNPESLPRPSSHVATPLDTPPSGSLNKAHLGVTCVDEDGMRLDYDNRFKKRTAPVE